MDEAILTELNKVPVAEWAKLWCKLNVFEMPDELGNIKPDWWDDPNSGERRHYFGLPIMQYISKTIGPKACNREWNREIMTDEEHEKFWKERPYFTRNQ